MTLKTEQTRLSELIVFDGVSESYNYAELTVTNNLAATTTLTNLLGQAVKTIDEAAGTCELVAAADLANAEAVIADDRVVELVNDTDDVLGGKMRILIRAPATIKDTGLPATDAIAAPITLATYVARLRVLDFAVSTEAPSKQQTT